MDDFDEFGLVASTTARVANQLDLRVSLFLLNFLVIESVRETMPPPRRSTSSIRHTKELGNISRRIFKKIKKDAMKISGANNRKSKFLNFFMNKAAIIYKAGDALNSTR